MTAILLTANNGAILGPIAKLMGWLMDGMYKFMYNVFGIESVALAITLLTILIYMLMMPLTVKQQKFSKLQQKMQPELNAITEKFKGRKDQESQSLQQQEISLVYKKYGVSPMGSCVQMLIQMPILFALYRVFYNIPAYISSVKDAFLPLANGIIETPKYSETITSLMNDFKVVTGSGLSYTNAAERLAASEGEALTNYIVDILYKLPSTAWGNLSESFSGLASNIADVQAHIQKFNYFLGLNISDTPMNIIKENWSTRTYLYIFIALMIPVLSWLTQVLSMKLSMAGNNTANDQMSQQMKTMNTMMPLMSLFICFSVPVGLGMYWILSAVVRTVQMVAINKHIENLDLDQIIAENEEKAKKEREKMGLYENQIREAAKMKTRTIEKKANINTGASADEIPAASQTKAAPKKGSMAEKANLVRKYNEGK